MNTATEPCRCGHSAEAHEHFRRGADCALCGPAQCSSFRRAVGTGASVGSLAHARSTPSA